MVKREFKAKIVDDFRIRWLEAFAISEGMHIVNVTTSYDSPELVELSKRISGKTVTLIVREYLQGKDGIFEKLDNNHPIPPSLFTEVL